MAVNAHCARVRVNKKTLLSAKKGAFNGGAKAIMPARAGAKARGTATITAAGSAFIPEEFQSSKKERKVLMPGDPEFERAKGVSGLSAQQIDMMGLGPDQAFRRPEVDPFSISARASYRNEMPCEANGGPASMVTAMAGSGGGGFTMSAGGGGSGGAGPPPTFPPSSSTRASSTSACPYSPPSPSSLWPSSSSSTTSRTIVRATCTSCPGEASARRRSSWRGLGGVRHPRHHALHPP